MKDYQNTIKQLLKKFKSESCTDEELLELYESSSSPQFGKAVEDSLPKEFSDLDLSYFSKKELDESFNELADKLRLQTQKPFLHVLKPYMRYAAIILLPVLGLLLGYYINGNYYTQDSTIDFAVEKGNKGYVELFDGTKVWLNGNSKLEYGTKSIREVKLYGQAYFEVKHNDKDKFKVKTDYFDIIVYGTSFDVSSYESDSSIEISLLEGSIGITDNGKDLFKIHPGQMISYDKKTKHYSVVDRDMTDITLWKEKELVIRDLNEELLFKKLSAWYQMDIKNVNKDPNNRMYNLVITNESLESMLGLISRLSPLTYKTEGKEVTVKFK